MKVWVPSLRTANVYRLSPKRQLEVIAILRRNNAKVEGAWHEHFKKTKE